MWRSILAVLAGIIIWAVLWVGSNAFLAALFPAQYKEEKKEYVPLLLLLIILSLIFSVIAGYLTARLAQRKEMTHTLVLGIIQLALGLVAEIANFDALPLWYHITFLALLIPGNVFGAMLRGRQAKESFA
jgi:hypothetical protein